MSSDDRTSTEKSTISSSTKASVNHQVFIGSSCDGTRYSFVSHLFAAFKRMNITVIQEDDKNLLPETRLYLPKQTRLAIEKSKICVVVISENFAFSKHSLTTLAEVIEWRHGKTSGVVVPVFYRIDRSVVEEQIGKFGEAFAAHETSEPKDRVIEWRNALKEAAQIDEGLDSNDESSDLKLVEDIVSCVHEKLFPADKIGINSKVLEIENLLSKQSWVVRSIGIWGMPGIGKTTLAKAAFDQMKGNYKSPRFIEDFEEKFEEVGMYKLRRTHLPLNVKDKLDINRSTNDQNEAREESVFLVLDDVRNAVNAESFLGGFEWFDPGSVLMITSRNKQVLLQCGMVEIYEVNGLDNEESLKLFSQCALGESQPKEGYMKVSDMVVKYANGNAKALSYYGGKLNGKTPEEMEIEFLQFKLKPPADILKVFKSSYDELSDDEKNIFLDIACFFKGDTVDRVMQVLDGCGFFPCIGIDYLVEKSLVAICGNRVEMHNLIQDVGKEILNQEVIDGMGRRLYDVKSIQPLLEDTTNVQPLSEDEERQPNAEKKSSIKNMLVVEDIESILLEASCLSFVVDPKAFSDMFDLRLLKIYSSDPEKRPGLDLCKGLVYLPCELRLLHWENYALRTLPIAFDPDNLVELNMPYSQLEELWVESKNLKSLKTISLHHSEKLVDIQELADAHYLQLIDLQGCTSLQSFPTIEHLYHLQVLNLCGCTGITIFPEVPPNIKELCLSGTSISEIPTSIESLSRLVKLDLGNCKGLLNFLVKIYNMEALELLNLSGCKALKSFPEIPKRVGNLKYLYLSGTAIEELHTSLSNIVGLKVLEVSVNLKTPFSLKDLKELKVNKIDEEINTSLENERGGS